MTPDALITVALLLPTTCVASQLLMSVNPAIRTLPRLVLRVATSRRFLIHPYRDHELILTPDRIRLRLYCLKLRTNCFQR